MHTSGRQEKAVGSSQIAVDQNGLKQYQDRRKGEKQEKKPPQLPPHHGGMKNDPIVSGEKTMPPPGKVARNERSATLADEEAHMKDQKDSVRG